MTTVRNKSRYDKEMTAITYNLKEQRVLEKSMQTLKLEQTYAMKLLELDNRIIKVHYRKLKERVSKIKSHLPPEDISKFRDLDQRGKLKPTISGVSSSGAIKIAAASRRLNLGDGGGAGTPGSERRRRCVRSAVPRISVENGEQQTYYSSSSSGNDLHKPPNTPEQINGSGGVLRRSNSVTGAFIDVPEPDSSMIRPGSASILFQKRKNNNNNNSLDIAANNRPSTAVTTTTPHRNGMSSSPSTTNRNGAITSRSNEDNKHRPTTSVRYQHEDSLLSSEEIPSDYNVVMKKPVIAFEKRPATTPHSKQQSHSPFSSHVAAEKEAQTNNGGLPVPSRSQMGRRMSHMSNDSIDSNLGENLFEERRQELLEEESVRAATLDKRTQMFLREVDDYIQRNPPLQPSHMAFEAAPRDLPRRDSFENAQAELDGTVKKGRHQIRRRRNDRPISAENAPTFFPEDKYREKLLSLWKDMNKCRYLRMPDERIDLSGVNTLVKDQMKLFETLRNAEIVPITDRGDE